MSKDVLIANAEIETPNVQINVGFSSQNVDSVKVQSEKKVEKPKLAVMQFCAANFIYCLNFLCGKVIFNHHPDLGSTQLMVYRSVVSCILLAIYLNGNLKNVMFDSVAPDSVPGLAVRTLTGNVAIFINFMSVKYFPLTTVAMMINCAPILTLILVGPILDEKVKLKDAICCIAAFLAIGLVILGNESVEQSSAYTPTTFAYAALILNPFLISSGNIAMKSMGKCNDSVVSCYMALSLLVVFTPICLLGQHDLTIWYRFSIVDWICLFGIGLGTILSQTLRFQATQNYKLSGLQAFTFLQPLQQFVTDIFLFQYGFTVIQFLGVQILIAIYLFDFCAIYWQEKKNENNFTSVKN